MDFRNSSQNRKAVKNERDSRSDTKSKIKSPPSIIASFFFQVAKSRKNVEKKWTSETRVRIEKQSKLREVAAPALYSVSKVYPYYTLFSR